MQCDNCGSEKFEVISVQRNRDWNPDKQKWIFSLHSDVRKVICRDCNQVYYTKTTKLFKAKYDETQLKIRFE